MLYQTQIASHRMCNAVCNGFERFMLVSLQSHWHKWKLISIHIQSQFATNLNQFDTNWSHFVAKVNLKYPSASLFMFASQMIAIDYKNVIPEGEKSCLPGGLELFPLAEYAELLLWNQPNSKGSQMSLTVEQIVQYCLSKHGNSIMISDC